MKAVLSYSLKPRRGSDWIMLSVVIGLGLITLINLLLGDWVDAFNSGIMALAFSLLISMGHLLDDATEDSKDITLMLVNCHDKYVAAEKWHDEVCDCGAFQDHVQEYVIQSIPAGGRVTNVNVNRLEAQP